MGKARVMFQELVQDSQEYGSDDEHMVSRVFFDLEVDGKLHRSLSADVKQAVGSAFEKEGLEVSKPSKYSGPFNYGRFREVVEAYYRSQVGSKASGIRLGAGAKDIRMRNNRFVAKAVAEFEVDTSGGW